MGNMAVSHLWVGESRPEAKKALKPMCSVYVCMSKNVLGVPKHGGLSLWFLLQPPKTKAASEINASSWVTLFTRSGFSSSFPFKPTKKKKTSHPRLGQPVAPPLPAAARGPLAPPASPRLLARARTQVMWLWVNAMCAQNGTLVNGNQDYT